MSLFTFIGPTSQPSPKDFPYIFHAVLMALQAIGQRSKVIGPPGSGKPPADGRAPDAKRQPRRRGVERIGVLVHESRT